MQDNIINDDWGLQMNLKTMLKKYADAIAAFLMSIFAGISMGSVVDQVFILGGGLPASYYPYRLPFNRFMVRFAFLMAAVSFILYFIYTIKRRDLNAEQKLIRFFIICFIAAAGAVMVVIFWTQIIETMHNLKRWMGLSGM